MRAWLSSGFIFLCSTVCYSSYFPKDYESSKQRFLNYESELRKLHPKLEAAHMIVGKEKLTVDSIYIPARKSMRNLIILTSGNHGPEGYAGSALQALFIEEILPDLSFETTGVLLIHALNPWGFKHNRRGTENNVNLNRNFDVSKELFHTQNPEYMRLKEFLEPPGKVQGNWEFPAKNLLLQLFKKDVSRQSLTLAIGSGQYQSAKGINYGGQEFESQTIEVTALLKKVAASYHAIFHIDLHTGLGEKETLHVMTRKGMNAASNESVDKLFNASQDGAHYGLILPKAEGFYVSSGDYAGVLDKLFPSEGRVIVGITAEFGTMGNGLIGKTLTINRLILENQGFNYGYATPEIESEVKQKFLEVFYPSSERWRANVLENGRYLLSTVVKRFVKQNP